MKQKKPGILVMDHTSIDILSISTSSNYYTRSYWQNQFERLQNLKSDDFKLWFVTKLSFIWWSAVVCGGSSRQTAMVYVSLRWSGLSAAVCGSLQRSTVVVCGSMAVCSSLQRSVAVMIARGSLWQFTALCSGLRQFEAVCRCLRQSTVICGSLRSLGTTITK